MQRKYKAIVLILMLCIIIIKPIYVKADSVSVPIEQEGVSSKETVQYSVTGYESFNFSIRGEDTYDLVFSGYTFGTYEYLVTSDKSNIKYNICLYVGNSGNIIINVLNENKEKVDTLLFKYSHNNYYNDAKNTSIHSNVKTGDNTYPYIWYFLLLVSCKIIFLIIRHYKRKQ